MKPGCCCARHSVISMIVCSELRAWLLKIRTVVTIFDFCLQFLYHSKANFLLVNINSVPRAHFIFLAVTHVS